MNITKNRFTLYAVTDRSCLKKNDFYKEVENALRGGVTFLQLREKNIDEDEFINEAIKVKKITHKYGVPLIINDSIYVTLCSGADGVHLGQNDMPVFMARKILGNSAIIGQTVKTVEQAIAAEKAGADYLGVGAAFYTNTKSDTWVISHDIYYRITKAVKIPVVAIGGINEQNALKLCGSGISGIAVASAIFGKEDTYEAAKRLKSIAEKIVHRDFFREIRRKKQKLTESVCIEILNKNSSGVLAVIGDNNYPYAVPLSYVYNDGKIFFHCAKSGHKIDSIKKSPKVSFCVVDQDNILPEKYTTNYRSVIVFGQAHIIDNKNEMLKAIEMIAKKYYPNDSEKHRNNEIQKSFDRLCLIELKINQMSGKQSIEYADN